jgi:adenylate cyclase class 2
MLEVEMKFPVADYAGIEERLARAGAPLAAVLDEEDHYFNGPDRDFARTDEALRLRRIGSANRVTYKGPKRDPQTKTRTEIEIPLAEGDAVAHDFKQILIHLGYRPSGVVRKHRRIYRLSGYAFPVEVCLDQVEGLGRFAEIEVQAPEGRLDEARNLLLKLAQEWGLPRSERRSYLELSLTAQGSRPP